MHKLTDEDLAKIKGSTIKGYHVEAAKVKRGPFIDSDHYGIILGKNAKEQYVTWEFHLQEDESVSVYWGHYMGSRDAAIQDYNARGMEAPRKFHVTVSETYQMTIEIEADSKEKAEQIVTNDWKCREFVLGPECFVGVEFDVASVDEQE